MTRNPPGMTRKPPGMTRNPPGMTRNPPGIDQESIRNPPGMTRNPPGIDQESIRNPPGMTRNPLGIITRNPPGMTRNDQESTGNDSLQSPTLSSFFHFRKIPAGIQLESSGIPGTPPGLQVQSRSFLVVPLDST